MTPAMASTARCAQTMSRSRRSWRRIERWSSSEHIWQRSSSRYRRRATEATECSVPPAPLRVEVCEKELPRNFRSIALLPIEGVIHLAHLVGGDAARQSLQGFRDAGVACE